MVLTISQETYDNAVQENMDEFGMEAEEAIEDTIKQFESQGVDLSHIIKNLMVGGPVNSHIVTDAVRKLGALVKDQGNKAPKVHVDELHIIKAECDKGLEYRILAGKEGAYDVILDTLLKLRKDKDVMKECFTTLAALMKQQPDLLNEHGVTTMISSMDEEKDSEIQRLLLKWVKECCVLHERNRQQIFNAGILDHLKPLLTHVDAELLKDVLAVLRALVLDDDIRVEFGKAHEHARVIASDTLCVITELLGTFKKDEVVMNDIMHTLSSLLVRTEFCKKVEDAGGLQVIRDALVDFQSNEKIAKQCLKLLKALAGNDECKAHLAQNNMPKIIVDAIEVNKTSPQTCINGLGCIAALTLRSTENSKALFEAGAPKLIVDILRMYPDNINVVQNASWAVRNMVSRSRNQNPMFLSLGLEPLLKEALRKHKKCEYDIKAALRDLGCDVDLKEAWTGKGGALNTQAKKK